jgi:hypothetical protein
MSIKSRIRLLVCLFTPFMWFTESHVWLVSFPLTLAAEDSPTDRQDILNWVRDLDSERFVERELATERLILSGADAIAPIFEALATNNLEVTTRGVHILQELALQSDLATSDAARTALEKVAAPRVTSAARRASEALVRLDTIRHERALEDLKLLGAVVDEEHAPLGFQIIEQLSIEIGERWRGQPADLVRLGWLRSIDQLVIDRVEFDDQSLSFVARMPDLPSLTIRNARITARGIASLQQLTNLRTLNILYCPIDDQSLESLEALKGLSRLRLYGTNLTAAGRDRLVQALRQVDVDVRRGAFLGIGCDPHQLGCIISTVRPDTAAEKAGLQVGDSIEEYDGKRVGSFEELTAAIAQNSPGDTVSVQIVRGGQTMIKKLELGDWERLQ